MNELLSQHPVLGQVLADHMSDLISAPAPQRESILALAEVHGIAVDRLPSLERALDRPRIEQARAVKSRADQLDEQRCAPDGPTRP